VACTGKIARLPHDLRAQLNSRLQDGQLGPQILPWLNSLPQVQALLAQDFHALPISQQNLSNWRQGGYQEWLVRQDVLALAAQLAGNCHGLAAAATGQLQLCPIVPNQA